MPNFIKKTGLVLFEKLQRAARTNEPINKQTRVITKNSQYLPAEIIIIRRTFVVATVIVLWYEQHLAIFTFTACSAATIFC